jgi:Sec-independent protein secretion pathway components
MFNLGGMEILVILVVALLVLGPDKLPQFMRTAGKIFGEFRRTSTEFKRAMHMDLADVSPSSSAESAQKNKTPSAPTPSTSSMTAPRHAASPTASVSAIRRYPRAMRVRRPQSAKNTEQV